MMVSGNTGPGNTGPASTPHLTLAQLAASGSNEPLGADAAAHLHTCPACQARTHDIIADGMVFLLSRCQPPPALIDRVLNTIDTQPAAQPAAARHGRPGDGKHVRWAALLSRHSPRRVAVAAAALAVLFGATAAGLVTALSPAGTGPAAEGGASAINHAGVSLTECPRLQLQVLGRTLQQVSGTDLELGDKDGTPLTVTTSAGTEILREVTGTPQDIADGAHVLVTGTAAGTATGAAIAGLVVDVMPGAGDTGAGNTGAGNTGAGALGVSRSGLAYGTAENVRGSGFTVVEGDGTRVQVTMSASSYVITAVRSSLGELQAGQATSVVASAGAGGALTAISVEQGSLPSAVLHTLKESLPGPGPGPAFPGGQGSPGPPGNAYSPNVFPAGRLPSLLGGANRPFASLGCDPSAITSVNLLAIALAFRA